MKRPLADGLYWLVFPRERVLPWSWAIWERLPLRVVNWIQRGWS